MRRVTHIRRVRPAEGLFGCRGFTLLELMAAMVILTIAMSVAFQAFSATIRGWRRGTEVVEGLQHGGYAMTHFVSALNSTIFFNNPRKSYAFVLERDVMDGLPADRVSFVTASPAFIPETSPLRHGPHRLELFIDTDEYGNPALYSAAFPAVGNYEEVVEEYDAEPHLVSREVQGIELLLYDEAAEEWTDDEWEEPNAIPERLQLILYVASEDENEEPIAFTRIIEIPAAESLDQRLNSPTTGNTGRGR